MADGARVTAFGVVQKLREALKLKAGATDQDVLDATLAALGKKGKAKEPDKEPEPEPVQA
jgi:hypothetical protein